MTTQGVHVTVAAGNSNTDASSTSPARAPAVITVGASTIADARASFSNYGSVVDILAPGSQVLSTYPGGGTASLSGTSMASPHVQGLAAYLAALEGNPGPAALVQRIKDLATQGAISRVPSNTVNLLAFNGNPSG